MIFPWIHIFTVLGIRYKRSFAVLMCIMSFLAYKLDFVVLNDCHLMVQDGIIIVNSTRFFSLINNNS